MNTTLNRVIFFYYFSCRLLLPPSLFSDLESLSHLVLYGNGMTSIDPALLWPLSKLTHIDLGDNMFSSLPDALFRNNTLLVQIKIRRDQCTDCPDGRMFTSRLLEGVANLTEFYYSAKSMNVTFSPDFFSVGCPGLERVTVQHARLPNSDLSIFGGLARLRNRKRQFHSVFIFVLLILFHVLPLQIYCI
jgi:hypothetical protein